MKTQILKALLLLLLGLNCTNVFADKETRYGKLYSSYEGGGDGAGGFQKEDNSKLPPLDEKVPPQEEKKTPESDKKVIDQLEKIQKEVEGKIGRIPANLELEQERQFEEHRYSTSNKKVKVVDYSNTPRVVTPKSETK